MVAIGAGYVVVASTISMSERRHACASTQNDHGWEPFSVSSRGLGSKGSIWRSYLCRLPWRNHNPITGAAGIAANTGALKANSNAGRQAHKSPVELRPLGPAIKAGPRAIKPKLTTQQAHERESV